MRKPYNDSDARSIVSYAQRLEGRTLGEVCENDEVRKSYSGKGSFGQHLEKLYFRYEVNSDAQPDFEKVGIELKSTPIKRLKKGNLVSKERLVLGIIDYMKLVDEEFVTSSFYVKNNHLLLVFYLWEQGVDDLDYSIEVVGEWCLEDNDLEVVKRDWEFIKRKVSEGRAHELSEGDTFYLGAATKGANSGSLREQPFSKTKAKQRAYSFKQGYVNHILASLSEGYSHEYGRLIPDAGLKEKTFEEVIEERMSRFYGLTCRDIEKELGVELNRRSKGYYASLTNRMLGLGEKQKAAEFEKAGIITKTIRIEQGGGLVESVSFPAFKFEEIHQQVWDESDLREWVESRYFFVFFKDSDRGYRLDKVRFWSMPFKDRVEVERVWNVTKELVAAGRIFKEYAKTKTGDIRRSKKGNPIRMNHFPKIRDSRVSHVRPHGTDSTYTYPLPVMDQKLRVKEYSRQAFWLNASYVLNNIYG